MIGALHSGQGTDLFFSKNSKIQNLQNNRIIMLKKEQILSLNSTCFPFEIFCQFFPLNIIFQDLVPIFMFLVFHNLTILYLVFVVGSCMSYMYLFLANCLVCFLLIELFYIVQYEAFYSRLYSMVLRRNESMCNFV